eukprot:357689-Pyramimonas_sp.AAC.1
MGSSLLSWAPLTALSSRAELPAPLAAGSWLGPLLFAWATWARATGGATRTQWHYFSRRNMRNS